MITTIGKYYLIKNDLTLITEIGESTTVMEIESPYEIVECENEEVYNMLLETLEKGGENV